MKKMYVLFPLLLLGFLGTAGLDAQVDNLSNMSAEWIRTSNRNAATDAADIVVYNPAGLVKLGDGFHLNISNQTLFRKPEHHFSDPILGAGTYQQDSPDWFLPNFYAAYKKGKWALFTGVYIPGGGAAADYPEGSITTHFIATRTLLTPLEAGGLLGIYDSFKDDYLEASSLYLTVTLGGAYALSDNLSLALGIRYITAKSNLKTGLTFTHSQFPIPGLNLNIDASDKADGFGAVLGLNFSPTPNLNIGIRYETKVKLEFETHVDVDDFNGALLVEGDKNRRDLPAMLGIGAAFKIGPKLTTEVDFNYYFQEQADWGQVMFPTGLEDYSALAGDSYGVGAALLYQFNPKLLLSAGLIYTKFLFDDMDGYYTNFGSFEVIYFDNLNLSAGFAFEVAPDVKLNFGVSYTDWNDPEAVQALSIYPLIAPVVLINNAFTIALGVDFTI